MAKYEEKRDELQLLKQDIRAKNVKRLYIFHGEETFLLQHYLNQLRKLLIEELTESFNFHKFNAETFDMQSFGDAVENLPMMADSTMVWVDDISIFKLNESDRQRMGQILSDIPDYCTIVFTYETIEWSPDKRMKKLWDPIEENARIVEFGRQEQRDLIPWIVRHFAAQHKHISNDLCAYLIDITGGTMTVLAGEINKICAYSGSDVIRKTDIDAVVEPVMDAVAYHLGDLLSKKQFGAALMKLQQLLKMQEDPIAVLGLLGSHFRRLGTARTLLDNGKTAQDLMRLYGIKNYPAQKAMESARSFSPRFYAKAALLVAETDYKMKTSADEKDRLLEMLILELAQEAHNG